MNRQRTNTNVLPGFRHRGLLTLLLILQWSYTADAFAFEWLDLWLTDDQQAQRLFDKGEYEKAAKKFSSPEYIGAALYLAGDFEGAASVFGRSSSAEASFNRGNSLVMLGQYEGAMEAFQHALIKKPGWPEAQQNLEIVRLRMAALAPPDDDAGGTGGKLGADEIVFDETGRVNQSSSEELIDAAEESGDEASMRAMWLRKVETRPADFLAARFYYQLATRDDPAVEQGGGEDDE